MRTVLLAAMVAACALHQALAQSGGKPEIPNDPRLGSGGAPAAAAPAARPQRCAQLRKTIDELQKHGQAIVAANRNKATVQFACELFRNYLAVESKMIEVIEADGGGCGMPPQFRQQLQNTNAVVASIDKQVCAAAAARESERTRPEVYDALYLRPVPRDRSQERTGDFWTADEIKRHFQRR